MIVLVWVGLALAALYGWLLGHWFARVVAFVVLGPICGLACVIGLGFLGASVDDWGSPAAVIGWCAGAVIAWWVASIPQRVLARRGVPPISFAR